MALRQFVSIQGHPKEIFSDNGTNLVAGERELREGLRAMEKENKILSKAAEMEIKCHFLPPSAPHFGGVLERLVRSAKTDLKAVLGMQTVQEEVLSTTFEGGVLYVERLTTHASEMASAERRNFNPESLPPWPATSTLPTRSPRRSVSSQMAKSPRTGSINLEEVVTRKCAITVSANEVDKEGAQLSSWRYRPNSRRQEPSW
jgi:hypothetical protein